MSRHKKKRGGSAVKLNMAAMLDMAFQLLTFFILTFKPSPIEGQVQLRMPPPEPITGVAGKRAGGDPNDANPVKGLNTLIISAISNNDGGLRQMAVGESYMGNSKALERKLNEVLHSGAGFDQIVVQVDSKLRYEGLMEVIEVCTKQTLPDGKKLTKLSFVEAGGAPQP